MPIKPVKPVAPLKPGQAKPLNVPDSAPLSANAQKFVPTADKLKQTQELQAKIKAYEKEIARLLQLQKAATANKNATADTLKNTQGIDPKLLKYFSYIDQHCSEFLGSLTQANKLLLRGQYDTNQEAFIAYPRENRKPTDSSKKAQALVDQALAIFGFTALRGNSIFTTTNEVQANDYGTAYAIFPKDGFSFNWTPKYGDLVLGEDDVTSLTGLDAIYDKYDTLMDEYDYFDMDSFCDKLEWNNVIPSASKIYKPIRTSPEGKLLNKLVLQWSDWDSPAFDTPSAHFVQIWETFHALSQKFPILLKRFSAASLKKFQSNYNKALVLAKDEKDGLTKAQAKKIIDRYKFTNKNFVEALKSGHEICIHGEYVAINFEEHSDAIKQYFLKKKKTAIKPKAK